MASIPRVGAPRRGCWASRPIETAVAPVGRQERPRRRPALTRAGRLRLPVAAIAVAAAATIAIALLPGATAPGPGGLSVEEASAAQVLRIAADNAARLGPALFALERRVVPYGGGQTETETRRSYAATDGSGRIETDGSVLRFAAGEPSVGRVNGFEDWRGVIDTADLPSRPTGRRFWPICAHGCSEPSPAETPAP